MMAFGRLVTMLTPFESLSVVFFTSSIEEGAVIRRNRLIKAIYIRTVLFSMKIE